MTEKLSEWVRMTAVAAVFCGIVLVMIPEGSEKRAVRLVCSLVLVLLLLRPLQTVKLERLPEIISAQRIRETELAEDTEEISFEVCRRIIREKTEEYIWDAAARLGISGIGIRLHLRDGESLPYPWSIDVTGTYTEEQREALSLLLEGELGIPRERQNWSTYDAG